MLFRSGQGNFLAAASIVVNQNSNNFGFAVSNPYGVSLAGTELICTITDPFNNTSEFSNGVTMS